MRKDKPNLCYPNYLFYFISLLFLKHDQSWIREKSMTAPCCSFANLYTWITLNVWWRICTHFSVDTFPHISVDTPYISVCTHVMCTHMIGHHPPLYCAGVLWYFISINDTQSHDRKPFASYSPVAIVFWIDQRPSCCYCVCLSSRVYRPPSSQSDQFVYSSKPSHIQHMWLIASMLSWWPAHLEGSRDGG